MESVAHGDSPAILLCPVPPKDTNNQNSSLFLGEQIKIMYVNDMTYGNC